MSNCAAMAVQKALRKFWMQGPPEGRVILAVSGGVDSMVLLEGVSRLCRDPADRLRLLVVHVNHGLRGVESDGDEALVLKRCAELGIDARSFLLSWETENSSQDLCRRKREAIFRNLCVNPGDRVWLAHHLNDQAETVFFRLLRGTGAKGLRAMLPIVGRKCRPFLSLEKSTLIRAAQEWGVLWREDSSNLDAEAYERNWLRGFFPQLEKRRPGFQKKLAALAEEAQGWKFEAEEPIDVFVLEPGVSFCRLPFSVSSKALAETFSLSRAHAKALAALHATPSGCLHVQGARFSWSAGILLWERGASFRPTLESDGAELLLKGTLGRWELGKGACLFDPGIVKGERLKKEFQALRVPIFFRTAIPLVGSKGREVALLPKRLDGALSRTGSRYIPSPLARWWLGDSY